MKRALLDICLVVALVALGFIAGRMTAPDEDLDALVHQFEPHPFKAMFWMRHPAAPIVSNAVFDDSPTFQAFQSGILRGGKPVKNDVVFSIFDQDGERHTMTLRRDAQLHPLSVDVTVVVPGSRLGYRYAITPDGSVSFAGRTDRAKVDEKIAIFIRAFTPNEKAASEAAFLVAST